MTWATLLTRSSSALGRNKPVEATNSLIRATQELRRQLTPQLDSSHPRPQVVHYTKMDVLYRILKTQIAYARAPSEEQGCLRLYDSIHLRDPKEGTFLLGKVTRRSLLSSLVDKSDPGAYILSVIQTGDSYFRGASDHLMLWRAYGDDGHGCSITFDYLPDSMHPVNYGEPAADQAAQKIDRVLSVAEHLCSEDSVALTPQLRDALRNLLNVRYYYKHDAYQLECEARVTSVEMATPEVVPVFHYQHPYIRHYVHHPHLQARNIFTSATVITIGPSVPQQENAERSVDQMLRDAMLFGPQVKRSPLPYRSL